MKKFFLGIVKGLGLIAGQAVPVLVASVNPPLGALLSSILNSILVAEGKYGAGNGTQKKEFVLGSVDSFAPLVLQTIETAMGKNVADDAAFAAGIDKITDGLVDVLNSMQVLPKGAQP